ncbi:MAG: hypothetical protein J5864_08890 [Oscillospiraceae bacterium]|nr:hypothetical protein [Oscillospiraceae bacterium]
MGNVLIRAVAETGKELFTKRIRETVVLAIFEGVTISTAKHFMDKLWKRKTVSVEEF